MTTLPHTIPYTDSRYRSGPTRVSLLARLSPTLAFYGRFLALVYGASVVAKRGRYDDAAWCRSSLAVLRALEGVGVRFEITGIEHLEQLPGPCVLIANHMSLLETAVLPVIVQPVRDVTFIVKQSLLDYPVFKHIMRSRDPIAVSRTNPRQDLKAVLEGGRERLQRGISVIVFPQTTRTGAFQPSQFTTLGIKLALKAGVPVVPLALLTDAWGNGKYFKDFGRIDASRVVRFAFGKPIPVEGRGADQHQAVLDYITGKLQEWNGGQATD